MDLEPVECRRGDDEVDGFGDETGGFGGAIDADDVGRFLAFRGGAHFGVGFDGVDEFDVGGEEARGDAGAGPDVGHDRFGVEAGFGLEELDDLRRIAGPVLGVEFGAIGEAGSRSHFVSSVAMPVAASSIMAMSLEQPRNFMPRSFQNFARPKVRVWVPGWTPWALQLSTMASMVVTILGFWKSPGTPREIERSAGADHDGVDAFYAEQFVAHLKGFYGLDLKDNHHLFVHVLDHFGNGRFGVVDVDRSESIASDADGWELGPAHGLLEEFDGIRRAGK